MAEIAEKVMAREAFQISNNRIIPKGTIIHFIQRGNERYNIYDKDGYYLGEAYNIPYEDVPKPIKPLD